MRGHASLHNSGAFAKQCAKDAPINPLYPEWRGIVQYSFDYEKLVGLIMLI